MPSTKQTPGCGNAIPTTTSAANPAWKRLSMGVVIALIALALYLRVSHLGPFDQLPALPDASQAETRTTDPTRFIWQADQLLAGNGYLHHPGFTMHQGPVPCTSLPPGYPIFLAGLFAISRSFPFVMAVQIALSVASCWLVYAAVRPRSEFFAIVALGIMATNSWLVAYSTELMSEILGVFLMSLLIFAVARQENRHFSKKNALAIGMLAMALPLTSPATAPTSLLLLCWTLWHHRRDGEYLLFAVVGAVLVMGPWQVYCYKITGHFVPRILTRYEGPGNKEARHWLNTWVRRPADFLNGANTFFWPNDTPDFSGVPDYAFSSAEERIRLETLRLTDGPAVRGRGQVLIDELVRITQQRHDDNWRYRHWQLRATRAFYLWWDTFTPKPRSIRFLDRLSWQSFQHHRADVGLPRAILRVIRGIPSGVIASIQAVSVAGIIVLLVFGVLSRKPAALAIVAGLLVYVWITSTGAGSELRRNQPFFPAILFLLYYLPEWACIPFSRKSMICRISPGEHHPPTTDELTVSVVIPCYNRGSYIQEAVSSILAQEGPFDLLEVLVVDDKSDDPQTFAAYSELKKFKNVKVLKNEGPRGPGATRNVGIRAARGAWIAFLDSDDVWLPGSLACRAAVIHEHPQCRWIGGDHSLWIDGEIKDSNGLLHRTARTRFYPDGDDAVVRHRRPMEAMLGGVTPWTCTMMIRRDLLLETGIFDETLIQAEDQHLWARLALKTDFYFVPKLLALYRRHQSNITDNIISPGHWRILAWKDLLTKTPFRYRRFVRKHLVYLYDLDYDHYFQQGRYLRSCGPMLESLSVWPANPKTWSRLGKSAVRSARVGIQARRRLTSLMQFLSNPRSFLRRAP